MATETMELGLLGEAVHHAVIGLGKELVKPIAKSVMQQRNVATVRDIVHRLIKIANLRHHFVVACDLLYEVADMIPDEDIPTLSQWLLPRCAENRNNPGQRSALEASWKLLQPIANRIPKDLAKRAVTIAFAHPVWNAQLEPNRVIPERKEIVDAVNELVTVLDVGDLDLIATEAIPLALERRQIVDYANVVSLLCHVTEIGGDSVKKQIAAELFSADKPLDGVLLQVVDTFKPEVIETKKLDGYAAKVAANIRLQVQWVKIGESHKEVGETLMTSTHTVGDSNRVVSICGTTGIHAVARHRKAISATSLKEFIETILMMAAERENFLDNRASLVYAVMGFADTVDPAMRKYVCERLEPLAKGDIQESAYEPPSSEADNPLNPFKFRSGSIDGLRSASLVTLAEFARFDSNLVQNVAPILEDAVYDISTEIRRGALAGIAKLGEVNESLLMAVLMATQNPDPNVVTTAFFAISNQATWKFSGTQWRAFLNALRIAVNSPEARVRQNAAAAARRWLERAPDEKIHSALEAILEKFINDVCASVRELAKGPIPQEGS
jgi:hypothetical protein